MEKQRSEAWFKKRVGLITGSNVGAILGCDPYRSKNDVLRAMVRAYHGADSEFSGNTATEYGTKFEPYAQADFEIESGLDVVETGFNVHPDQEWIGASPDGLIDEDGVLEIKCPYGKRESNEFKSYVDQPHYYGQMQIEMYCTNRKKCYFYQWAPKGSMIEIVEYSQLWIDENVPKLKAFYDLFLSEIDNDAHLSSLVQTKESNELASRYTSAKAKLEDVKSELEEARKELIALADGKKTNISGLLVYPIERSGSISYSKAVKTLLPNADLSEFKSKPSKTWGIR